MQDDQDDFSVCVEYKMISNVQDWERRIGMFPNRTISSGEGSFPSSGELGRNSSMPSLKGRPIFPNKPVTRFPPHFSPPCNPYIFDAARFACEKKPTPRPRYLDRDRERHVTRWLMEAQDALEKMEPKKKPSSKKKPFLRRFHSHDSNKDFITSAFDDSWNENFILADSSSPKKTKALLKRFQSTNNEGLYDGSDFNTRNDSFERSESAKSRRDGESSSPQSTGASSRKLTPREFLDRYKLPRVASLEGEVHPLLLYKHISSYTRVEAVRLTGKKNKPVGKPIYIPEGYQGWFAVVSGGGNTSAKAFNSLAELVRARVPCFLPAAPLPAYLLQRDPDGERWSYVKGSARGGTPLRLAGVFEEAPRGSRNRSGGPASLQQTPSSPPQRYAQLVDPNLTELYVPLSTKGEFYPIHMEIGGQDGDQDASITGLQRLSSLLRRSLPLRVRLVAGPALPPPLHPTLTTGTLLLRAVTTESVIVTCSITESTKPPSLALLTLNTDRKLQKAQLGYDSAKVHKALTYCQMHVDTWIRQITFAVPDNTEKYKAIDREQGIDESLEKESKLIEKKTLSEIKHDREKKFTFQGLKVDASRLFGKSDKILKDIPDENEGSIIFISKNELENMNYDVYREDEVKKEVKKEEHKNVSNAQPFSNDKMKVFRENSSEHPKLSKWFKHLKIVRSSERLAEDSKDKCNKKLETYKGYNDPFDPEAEKRNSLERYFDVSKLIADRYGPIALPNQGDELSSEKWQSYRSLATSSDIGIGSSIPRSEPKQVLTKSVSVQTGILDSPYTDDRMSDLGRKKNLSIEQINYYSENDSSLKKRQIYTGNCAKRTENYSGKHKVSKFERRQRIRPDLIPEKSDRASSESFDQIQSCEDFNAFGTGSSCSEHNSRMNFNQNSFITEKLCSEFHVKTKRVLSKSTSNLLVAKVKKDNKADSHTDIKMLDNGIDCESPPSLNDQINTFEDDKKEHVKVKRSISSIQSRKLPVIEDLPYGQVADAITERAALERRDSDLSDNIYAEVGCPELNKIKSEDCFALNHDIKDKIKNEANKQASERQFRHIEVVVIERHDVNENNLSDSDFADSESDEKISGSASQKNSSLSESGGFSAGNSLEKDNNNKMHAIRLEVTHNDVENDREKLDPLDSDLKKSPNIQALKNGSYVKLCQGITVSDDIVAEDNTESIYNTLK